MIDDGKSGRFQDLDYRISCRFTKPLGADIYCNPAGMLKCFCRSLQNFRLCTFTVYFQEIDALQGNDFGDIVKWPGFKLYHFPHLAIRLEEGAVGFLGRAIKAQGRTFVP